MKSPEQMGGSPEQPKEEPVKDKEETPEKPTSPESYNEAEWEKLKQGGAAFAINKGKEIGVPQEELDRFAEDVIARETKNQNYGLVYRFRKNMRIGTEEEVRAAGEQAYKFFLESEDFGSAMSIAEDVYSRDSEEWRRAHGTNETEWKKTEERRKRKEEEMEDEEWELNASISKDATFTKSILEYWQNYIKNPDPLIKDWLKKENGYLKENVKKGAIVLDVGCGFGRSIEAINKIAKKIVGIDNNKPLCKKNIEKLSKFKNVEFFCENAEKMHFPNNTFDYVICMGNTFGDFAENKLKILKEMKRVVKSGGKIIISVYSEKALNVRKKEYKRIGIKIKKIDNGTIFTDNHLILEQFDKRKLQKNFNSAELKVKIIRLNLISYICVATVKK